MAVASLVALGLTAGSGLAAQDPSATANYGTVNLNGGFMPDPHTVSVTAGGSIRVNRPSCTYGNVSNNPDFKVQYSGNGQRTLYIYATSGSDVTLLVNTANGSWMCNDDGLGNGNPILIIPGAGSGRYDIWVGTYGTSTAPAQLMISEIDPRGRSGGGGGGGGGGDGASGINPGPPAN